MSIERWIQEQYLEQMRRIEEAVEKSIQGGTCGVRIYRTRLNVLIRVDVSEEVPYGHIHEHITD